MLSPQVNEGSLESKDHRDRPVRPDLQDRMDSPAREVTVVNPDRMDNPDRLELPDRGESLERLDHQVRVDKMQQLRS